MITGSLDCLCSIDIVLSQLVTELAFTIWLQIFVVENFCDYTVITKILCVKFSYQLIILDTRGAR